MTNLINIDTHLQSQSAMLKAEIESDLRRAALGSEKLGNHMLAYLIRMAVTELKMDEKMKSVPTDKYFLVD